ncbi:5-(carboxyamino)imidazole ribonucleotide synthase [Sphingomonas piscis]|uniref:N5-carboxyaminoimidazole ribonucleotide synthase n=1 Tax=Sphingomonas piscis TaxID=2714943 RepID=A0A6G7YQ32_9SPHN|nr:5-(carboxyamino)imidazole ribonucleotide synthase [Sphingomonas piscis]QIK78844.1 5-(carboxyamino)imidazole ribonucleotide synthase [Sphingomonas piscis]
MIDPGGTIGIIGGGQLGRMLSIAAAQLGYRTHIFAPEASLPAGDVAAAVTRANYDDEAALRAFADQVDVATYEFENLPAASLAALGAKLMPGTASLEIAQDRGVEKSFLEKQGARVAAWRMIDSEEDVIAAEQALGLPLVLKSRRLGYDGKGQAWVREPGSGIAGWDSIDRQPAVAEAAVGFDAEFSIIVARSQFGDTASWDAPHNHHDGGILRRSSVPPPASILDQAAAATAIARTIAEALNHVGVLTTEFFATADGPIVNEIAPRVHNSGHWTIEGAATSQFEQHIRAICGLPLGSTERRALRVTMDNLIGDDVLRWPDLIAEPGASVHLYGKGEPRPGRKMGHVTRLTAA